MKLAISHNGKLITTDLHLLPGRVRLRVPELYRNRELAGQVEQYLITLAGVNYCGANPRTGRILVLFDDKVKHYSELVSDLTGFTRSYQGTAEAESADGLGQGLGAGLGQGLGAFSGQGRSAGRPPISRQNYSVTTGQGCTGLQEPEDLPLGGQIFQVVLGGAAILYLGLKNMFRGRSAWSSSPYLFNAAALVTIVSAYPTLRSGVANLTASRRINHDLMLGFTILTLLAARESITGLVVSSLVNVGTLLETITVNRVRRTIREQVAPYPELEVHPGTEVAVREGEIVPGDGVVVSGKAVLGLSRFLGAAGPVNVKPGESVSAGAKVFEGEIRVRIEHAGEATTLARLAAQADLTWRRPPLPWPSYPARHGGWTKTPGKIHCAQETPRALHPVEIYSRRMLVIASGLAAGAYLLSGSFSRPLAIILAAAPSTFSVAAPSALGAGVAKAAEQGILVRDARRLALAGQLDTVAFDKTGTLTGGDLRISEVRVLSAKYSKEEILSLAAAAEGDSGHPVAGALRSAAAEQGLQFSEASALTVEVGRGVTAKVMGREVLVGGPALLKSRGVCLRSARLTSLRREHPAEICVLVACERRLIGLIFLRDPVKPEAQDTLAALDRLGVKRVVLISGDTAQNSCQAASDLGIEEYYADLSPAAKARLISNLQKGGRCIGVVGDGSNDNPALVQAQVGIALGTSGPDSAARVADIVIAGDDPRLVSDALGLGREVNRVLGENYALGAAANLLGLGLALAGVLTPISAGVLINTATVLSLLNSLRVLKANPSAEPGITGPIVLQVASLPGQAAQILLQPVGLMPVIPPCLAPEWEEDRDEADDRDLLLVEE